MKIIANLICLNSAPELPELLESLKGRVDGLVAVDGGSTDDTVGILNAWAADAGIPVTVKSNRWPDDFGLQRNLCLNVTRVEYGMATEEEDIWVLMIDSDDTLAEFDRAYLEKATQQCGIAALLVRMDNSNGFFNVVQFFRLTPNVLWQNPIHEFVIVGGPKGLPPVGTLTIKRGRSNQHDNDPERNIRIGRRFVEACPKDTRARFYMARDLLECEPVPTEQRRAESEGHLRAYLALGGEFLTQDRYARLLLVRLLCDSGRHAEARSIILESLATDPDNKSAYEALACISEEKESGVWHRLAASAEGASSAPKRLSEAKARPSGSLTNAISENREDSI